MKIGIIGSGAVGQNLAKGFAEIGHEVMIGTRDPKLQKVKDTVQKLGQNIKLGTFDEAAKFAELGVFAINWMGVENAIKLAQPKNLENKIVIDTTNPLDFSKGPALAVSGNNSSGETVQKLLAKSKVVKALNIVGAADMFKPKFQNGPPTMLICGNDKPANDQVAKLLNNLGWTDIIDLGGIENSRYLEPLLLIRMVIAVKTGNWTVPAFKLIKQIS